MLDLNDPATMAAGGPKDSGAWHRPGHRSSNCPVRSWSTVGHGLPPHSKATTHGSERSAKWARDPCDPWPHDAPGGRRRSTSAVLVQLADSSLRVAALGRTICIYSRHISYIGPIIYPQVRVWQSVASCVNSGVVLSVFGRHTGPKSSNYVPLLDVRTALSVPAPFAPRSDADPTPTGWQPHTHVRAEKPGVRYRTCLGRDSSGMATDVGIMAPIAWTENMKV